MKLYIYIYIKYTGYLLKFLTYVKFDVRNVLSPKTLGQLMTVSTLFCVSCTTLLPIWAHTLLCPQSAFSSQHVLRSIRSSVTSVLISAHCPSLPTRLAWQLNNKRHWPSVYTRDRILGLICTLFSFSFFVARHCIILCNRLASVCSVTRLVMMS